MTKPFDPTKPVQTRDGRKARIICTDRKGRFPLIYLVTEPDGTESCISAEANGVSREGHVSRFDLVNIPVKKEGWINVYSDSTCFTARYGSYEAAKARGDHSNHYITTIKIEWEE